MIWAVALKRSDKVIGMINYHRRELREKRVDMGWLLLPGMHGKGYMTEAGRALLCHLFDDLGVHKVEALIRPENISSERVALKLGMLPEGMVDAFGFPHRVHVVTKERWKIKASPSEGRADTERGAY